MPEYEIFIPAFTFAHVLGLSLLLYSLEKVSGVVSKTWNRVTGRIRAGGRTEDSDQLDRKSSAEGPHPTVELEVAAQKARTAVWRRGCSCEVGALSLMHSGMGSEEHRHSSDIWLRRRGIEMWRSSRHPVQRSGCDPPLRRALRVAEAPRSPVAGSQRSRYPGPYGNVTFKMGSAGSVPSFAHAQRACSVISE